MGVVSVSPVARQHTRETTKESATAMTPSTIEMWNARYWTATMPIVMGTRPASSQLIGTSMACMAAFWGEVPFVLKIVNARANVRHSNARFARLAKTMIDVPPQIDQRVGVMLPAAFMAKDGT